jgi:dihydrofolate reductase
MIISIIAAGDECGGIGVQNSLPWRLKADQKRFKRLTMGHHLIMGRKTYQAIGRSLPGRTAL